LRFSFTIRFLFFRIERLVQDFICSYGSMSIVFHGMDVAREITSDIKQGQNISGCCIKISDVKRTKKKTSDKAF